MSLNPFHIPSNTDSASCLKSFQYIPIRVTYHVISYSLEYVHPRYSTPFHITSYSLEYFCTRRPPVCYSKQSQPENRNTFVTHSSPIRATMHLGSGTARAGKAGSDIMTSLTLSREYYLGEVAKLGALRDKITTTKGSAAKRLHDATLTALAMNVPFEKADLPTLPPLLEGPKGSYVNLGGLAQFVVDLNEWANNLKEEAVTGLLKSQPTSDLTVLSEQYNTQRETVLSLRHILTQVASTTNQKDLDVSDVEIPALRKGGGRPASSGSRPAGTRHIHFYRIVNGTKVDQPSNQDKLSSIAWYFGAKIVPEPTSTSNQGRGVPVDVLTKYLASQGVDSPNGKAWTHESDGVTYGMEIVGGDEKAEEE